MNSINHKIPGIPTSLLSGDILSLNGEYYILAYVGTNKFNLISLSNGDKYYKENLGEKDDNKILKYFTFVGRDMNITLSQ